MDSKEEITLSKEILHSIAISVFTEMSAIKNETQEVKQNDVTQLA